MKLHQKLFWLLVLLLPLQLGRHFWPDFAYIQGLRVDYLSPTIYLTDILVLAILFFWLLDGLRVNALRKHWLVLVFFLFLLVNSLLAKNSSAALYKFFKILELFLLGYYVARNNYTLNAIRSTLPLAVIYSSLIAVAQFLRQSSLNGIFWFLGERTFNAGTPGIAKTVIAGRLLMRPYATFSHPNALAGFILVSLILILTRNPKHTTEKLNNRLAIVLGLFTILISFSRSAWIVGFLAIGLIVSRFSRLRVTGYGFTFLTGESLIQRTELNKVALQLIKQYPLAGVGLNNFIVRLPEFWQPQSLIFWLQPVHNVYLLIAAETGLVGLIIFLWFLFLTFKKLNAKRYALIAILMLGFADHYWLTLQQNQLLLAIVLGLSWANKKGSSRSLRRL